MHRFLPLSESQLNTLTAEGKGASFCPMRMRLGGDSEVKEKGNNKRKKKVTVTIEEKQFLTVPT